MTHYQLDTKVAVVTGAARGIGAAIAASYAQAGATVIICDINDEAGTAAADQIGASYQHADITVPDQIAALVQTAVDRYGRLDIWVNNAKPPLQAKIPLVDMPLDTWNAMLNVCLTGAFLGAKYALPVMVAHGGGVIINISSPHGFFAYPHEAAYDAAKAGLLALTRTIAADYGPHNVRCNTLVPGATAPLDEQGQQPAWMQKLRPHYPLGRVSTPQDLAEAALFLASDSAQFINGATLTVDGGMSIRSPEYLDHR